MTDGIAAAIAIASGGAHRRCADERVARVTAHTATCGLSSYADIAALEAAEGAVNSDASFVALVDSSGMLSAGCATAIYRRLS
jgi:hypothetical protein